MTNANLTPIRIGVFYDGNVFLHISNYYNYIHPKRARLDIKGLHKFIITKVARYRNTDLENCDITESHYFRGRLHASKAAEHGSRLYNDRVVEDILMAEGIQTHYLPLRRYKGRYEEKGINSWLSLKAQELAIAEKIDIAVFILSDAEYIPLFRNLKSLGIRTILLSWEFEYINVDGESVITKTSHDLIQNAKYPIGMAEEIETGLSNRNQMISDIFVKSEAKTEDNLIKTEISRIITIIDKYGFIEYPDNNLFFHKVGTVTDFSELEVGDTVEFEIAQNDKEQNIAVNVRKI